MKFLIVLLSLLMVSPSFAVRRVGFGGGDAENIVLRMADRLPEFTKACQENKGLCEVVTLKVPRIAFEEEISQPYCDQGVVIIPRDILYVDDKTPKNNYELAQILVTSAYTCQAAGLAVEKPFQLLPIGKILPQTSVVALEGKKSDVLVSTRTSQNLHLEFQKQSACAHYRVMGLQNQMFLVKCLSADGNFLVSVEETATRIDLHSRFWAE